MKKIVMVLMMVFSLSVVFAKPVVFDVGNSKILTDDENKLIVYTGTYEDLCTEMLGIELFGVYPSGVTIDEEIDWVSEKFNSYILVAKDVSYALNVINLGFGLRAVAFYDLKENLEKR